MENITAFDNFEPTTFPMEPFRGTLTYSIFYRIVPILFGSAIVLSNLSIILTFLRNDEGRKAFVNIYIFYLAIADILIGGLVLIPLTIWEFTGFPPLPIFVCASWSIVTHFSVTSSVVPILFLSFDRYLLVNDPLLYITKITAFRIHVRVLTSLALCFIYCILLYHFSAAAAYTNRQLDRPMGIASQRTTLLIHTLS